MRHPKKMLSVKALSIVFSTMLFAATSHAASKSVNELNIYNWDHYIAPDLIKNFEKETGIKVRYDLFNSNEMLHAKLMAGQSGYDIVVPSSVFANLQIQGNLLHKLDKSKIPNLKNLNPRLLKKLEVDDPGNQYLVDWLWGYLDVVINPAKVKAALGDLPMPKNPWSLIYDPVYAKKVASCGLSVTDSAIEVVPLVLLYLGKNPQSTNPADYAAVSKLLTSIRPYVRSISSDSFSTDMANGNLCVSMGYSSLSNLTARNATNAKSKITIEPLAPNHINIIYFDTMAIPKDAPHLENAYKFINYVLQPKVAASLTNASFGGNPTMGSEKYIRKDILDNPTITLTTHEIDALHPPVNFTNKIRIMQNRVFTSFKLNTKF